MFAFATRGQGQIRAGAPERAPFTGVSPRLLARDAQRFTGGQSITLSSQKEKVRSNDFARGAPSQLLILNRRCEEYRYFVGLQEQSRIL